MSTKFTPTAAELALVSQIFAQADPQKLGILTGDVAVRMFGGAKLQPSVLGEIWSIADEDNNGWLPKKGVAIALRLMGWAQKGEKVTRALVNQPGPLPTIEGINSVAQNNTGVSISKSPPPGFPPLTSQDRAKFLNIFNKSRPVNGLLSGEQARDIFLKSGLSNEKLLQIWNLADTQDRGSLDPTDFAIGMYFIQGLMSGQLSFIPNALPPGLYQQAGGNPAAPGSARTHMTGNSGSFSPVSSTFPQSRIQPQYTGQGQSLQQNITGTSPSMRSPTLSTRPEAKAPRNAPISQWDVTPAEKSNSDRLFDELDTQRRGYIEGDVAVPFMLKSDLPGEILAQVWDLADLNNDGRLTRDGFAVAMHLIQKKLAGIDVPSTLPPSLLPPSMRTTFASPFLVNSPRHEPQKDLLWDDSPSTPVAPSMNTQTQAVAALATATSDPFGSAFSPQQHQDLLGDDEDTAHAPPPLHDQSAEIGNLQNQLKSNNRSLDAAKRDREIVEQQLASQASQLSALQTQLSSAKAAYETETKLLTTLKDRQATQLGEIQKTREELIRAESDLSALRVEKAEIEGAFLRDKEESRDLHKRMIETGQQTEALKVEIEKLKKEAKQQKGLLAIARKQLSTKETEKAKIDKELETANEEVSAVAKEREEAENEFHLIGTASTNLGASSDSLTFAANQPLPSSPDQMAKSNNPFERLAMASNSTPPKSQSQSSFLSFSSPTPPTQQAAAFESGSSSLLPESETATPKAPPASILAPEPSAASPESALSSTTEDSDDFMTPPTTANNQQEQSSTVGTEISSLNHLSIEEAAPHFPDINESGALPKDLPKEEKHEQPVTDLGSQLKEIEIEESDSDEEDQVPLAELSKKVHDASSAPQPSESPTISQQDVSAPMNFDDIFGVMPSAEPPAETSQPQVEVKDSEPGPEKQVAAESPPNLNTFDKVFDTSPEAAAPSGTANGISGVNAFDEAMERISVSVPQSTAPFSFESAFEDTFDFPAATEKSFMAHNGTESTPIIEGDSSVKAQPGPAAEPDLFSSSNGTANLFSTSVPPVKPAFDDVFDSVPDHETNSSVPPNQTILKAMATGSEPATFPTMSATSSPKAESPSRSPVARSYSPVPRTKSPSPRVSSPKPRASTSSKETHHEKEKVKEPSVRQSKLSIRLPFGKKRKQHDSKHAPLSSTLSPPTEESMRSVSPAVDDDVEAVKQLTAMGFSRSQSVAALEKYGYDVPRALNSLLGAP